MCVYVCICGCVVGCWRDAAALLASAGCPRNTHSRHMVLRGTGVPAAGSGRGCLCRDARLLACAHVLIACRCCESLIFQVSIAGENLLTVEIQLA
jgi:hypothetical protein